MSEATVVTTAATEVAANPFVVEMIGLIREKLGVDLNELRNERNKIASTDTRYARELMKLLETNDVDEAIDTVKALVKVTKNEEKKKGYSDKLGKLEELKNINSRVAELDEQLAKSEAVLNVRGLIGELRNMIGDKAVHRTYTPKGDKTGADGKTIPHGNQFYLFNTVSKTRVPRYVNNKPEEVWLSVNEIIREIAPEELSPIFKLTDEKDPFTGKREQILDENGEPIPVLDKNGEQRMYNVSVERAQVILRKRNLVLKPAIVTE